MVMSSNGHGIYRRSFATNTAQHYTSLEARVAVVVMPFNDDASSCRARHFPAMMAMTWYLRSLAREIGHPCEHLVVAALASHRQSERRNRGTYLLLRASKQ